MSGLIVASSMLTTDCVEAVPSWLSAQSDGAASEGNMSSPGAERRGEGVPRQGDTGPGISQGQRSLVQIPQFYDAEADGGYDIEVRAAVARFQA